MITIDLETRSRIDIRKAGAWRYSLDSSTEVLCMAYAINDDAVKIWVPEKFALPAGYPILYHTDVPLWMVDENEFKRLGGVIEAHNASFEQSMWINNLQSRYGAITIPPIQWRDSMALCAANALPLSLENVGIALDLPIKKNLEGRRVMLQLSQPRIPSKTNPKEWWEPIDVPEKFATLFSYCMDDVAAEREISKKLPPLTKQEQWVWTLDQIINQRGIPIDVDLVNRCLDIIKEHETNMKARCKQLTNGEVPSPSLVAKLLAWVQSQGVATDNLQKATLEALLEKEGVPEHVKEVLRIRQSLSKTSTKKLVAMLEAASPVDNLVRYTMMYHGASTGRWAGRLIQVQNFPRGTLKDVNAAIEDLKVMNASQINEKYGDPMEVISSCLRGMIAPQDGTDILAADYAAIEARIVMWFADEYEALDTFRNEQDIYVDMAAFIYSQDPTAIDKSTKEGANMRQLGKQAILGCGFGMAAPKFKITCQGYGMDVDDDLADKAVKGYRKKYAGVPAFWRGTENAAINAILTGEPQDAFKCTWFFDKEYNFLRCRLPSGRCLSYYDPRIGTKYGVKWTDKNTKKWNYKFFNDLGEATAFAEKLKVTVTHVPVLTYMGVNSTTKQWVRSDTYGGHLVENIVQATARDCMVTGLFKIEKAGYKVFMTIHDEIVARVPTSFGSVEELEALLSQPPEWAPDMPIKAEGWRGPRYRK